MSARRQWGAATIRICRKTRQCDLCWQVIRQGERYYEAGEKRRYGPYAHLACGAAADRGETVLRSAFLPLMEISEEESNILPEQFFPRLNVEHNPTLRFAFAILENAIDDIRRYACRRRRREIRLFMHAMTWVLTTDEQWPFSFHNICGYFNIEAQSLRHHLLTKYGVKEESHDSQRVIMVSKSQIASSVAALNPPIRERFAR